MTRPSSRSLPATRTERPRRTTAAPITCSRWIAARLELASHCPGSQPQVNLLYGDLANVSTYAFSGSECGVDLDGSYSWASPPSGNLFILLVSEDGTLESSWGFKRIGGVESQRSTSASGLCGNSLIDTTSTCPRGILVGADRPGGNPSPVSAKT